MNPTFFILFFLLTILIEFVVYLFFIKNTNLKLFFYSLIINCFTWPLANYVYPIWINNLILVELIVFIIEIFLRISRSLCSLSTL